MSSKLEDIDNKTTMNCHTVDLDSLTPQNWHAIKGMARRHGKNGRSDKCEPQDVQTNPLLDNFTLEHCKQAL